MAMVSGSTPVSEEGSMRLSMARSYCTSATRAEGLKRMFAHIRVLIMALMTAGPAFFPAPTAAPHKPLKIAVLGHSLGGGLRPPAPSGIPGRPPKSLDNHRVNSEIVNAG